MIMFVDIAQFDLGKGVQLKLLSGDFKPDSGVTK